MRQLSFSYCVILTFAMGVCGCSTSDTDFNGDSSYYDSERPKIEKQRVGRPYQIGGQWYTPEIDNDYDEVGIASWYGPGFDGRPTANGEIFDENTVSAAHTTLPLPSYVEVTNLDNGKQLYVRINDRGPFSDDRIIDLSKRAAELLGSKSTGLARVRVALAPPPKNVTLLSPDGQKIIGKSYKPTGANTAIAQNSASKPYNPQQTAMGNLPLYTSSTQQTSIDNKPLSDVPAVYDNPFGRYAIKIGVFSDENNVASLKENLAPLGNVQIDPVYQNGRTLSRVLLNGYRTQEEALTIVNNLTSLGIYDAKIINQ